MFIIDETDKADKERILKQEYWLPYDGETYPNGLGKGMQDDVSLAAWDEKYGF